MISLFRWFPLIAVLRYTDSFSIDYGLQILLCFSKCCKTGEWIQRAENPLQENRTTFVEKIALEKFLIQKPTLTINFARFTKTRSPEKINTKSKEGSLCTSPLRMIQFK